jgi:D-3-phosphoglycerate dehydrogenase / 2-oxoglutarate reductase
MSATRCFRSSRNRPEFRLQRVRKTLLIAADVDRSLHERAAADGRFEIIHRPVRTEEELAGIIGGCEILVTRSFNRVTRRVIDRAPRLELIAQGTSGTDNIDHAAARERGITILNLPGANADAVAELVIGFMIALSRTVPAYTRELARGIWNREECATRHELRHHRLGIVGLGEVGKRVARLAAAFGMRVSAVDPYISEFPNAARVDSLDELLRNSDILTLHVPLTSETRRMIGAPQIAAMPPGSILINAARGEVLDQRAALDALQSNHLAGLALDVFDPEPPSSGFPDDPRLILTPHIAGCTHEAKAAVGAKLFEKIAAFYTN